MPSHERGLLARLDALVELVADRHGLALLPGGRLAAAEARVAARAAGLSIPAGLASFEAVANLASAAPGFRSLWTRAHGSHHLPR